MNYLSQAVEWCDKLLSEEEDETKRSENLLQLISLLLTRKSLTPQHEALVRMLVYVLRYKTTTKNQKPQIITTRTATTLYFLYFYIKFKYRSLYLTPYI